MVKKVKIEGLKNYQTILKVVEELVSQVNELQERVRYLESKEDPEEVQNLNQSIDAMDLESKF